MGKVLTVMGAGKSAENISKMPQNLSNQNLGFQCKKASSGVHSPWTWYTLQNEREVCQKNISCVTHYTRLQIYEIVILLILMV